MPFVKGQPKPPGSGQKKGGKQKPTMHRETLSEMLRKLNINVLHELLRYVAPDSQLSHKDQSKIWLELLSYLYPKPRVLDVTVDNSLMEAQKEQILSEMGHKISNALIDWKNEGE